MFYREPRATQFMFRAVGTGDQKTRFPLYYGIQTQKRQLVYCIWISAGPIPSSKEITIDFKIVAGMLKRITRDW